MYTQIEKPKENKSLSVANSVAQKKSNGRQGFGFVDNRPEAIAQKKLQGIPNNSITRQRKTIQMMAKEKEGSDEYNHLKGEKDDVEDQLTKIGKKTEAERKEQALNELVKLKNSQLLKYGKKESYTPYYHDESKEPELRTAWRMCEDERKGKDPLHIHQTKSEIDAYVTKRAARILEKEGKEAYNLRQQSSGIAQLKSV